MTDKQKRGFALLDPERRKEIASKGGKSSAPEKRYYSTHKEAARVAGARGGSAPKKKAKK